MIISQAPFDRLFQMRGFGALQHFQGEIYRSMPDRTTSRFEYQGKYYFLKWHKGVGWVEIIKNLVRFRLPVLGATPEWQAIKRLESHNISTLNAVVFGRRGISPAHQESFLITDAIEPSSSLEYITNLWIKQPPSFQGKKTFVERLAEMVKQLHGAGVNHRDLYLCHFLIDFGQLEQKWSLIDLHRAQTRNKVPQRWVVKDLAALAFSAQHLPLTQRDYWRFAKIYFDGTPKKILSENRTILKKIQIKSLRLKARKEKYGDQI